MHSIPTSRIGHGIIVTMSDGQQVLTVPATDIAKETVITEEPPAKCMEIIENRVESAEIEERGKRFRNSWMKATERPRSTDSSCLRRKRRQRPTGRN